MTGKIVKCLQCPQIIKRKNGILEVFECRIIGRPVNPETRPPDCHVPECFDAPSVETAYQIALSHIHLILTDEWQKSYDKLKTPSDLYQQGWYSGQCDVLVRLLSDFDDITSGLML